MQKKSQDFSLEDAMRLAESPIGQQLIAMLQQADAGQIAQARNQADVGDLSGAVSSLQGLLSSPEARELLEKLGR